MSDKGDAQRTKGTPVNLQHWRKESLKFGRWMSNHWLIINVLGCSLFLVPCSYLVHTVSSVAILTHFNSSKKLAQSRSNCGHVTTIVATISTGGQACYGKSANNFWLTLVQPFICVTVELILLHNQSYDIVFLSIFYSSILITVLFI